jgi:hypothetical protein
VVVLDGKQREKRQDTVSAESQLVLNAIGSIANDDTVRTLSRHLSSTVLTSRPRFQGSSREFAPGGEVAVSGGKGER